MSIRYLSGIDVDANTLFVDSANDRVGIGTGSPTYKFEVSNGTITGTMNPNSSGFMFIGSTTNHPLYFGVYDATRMMISTAGNVGIGTTSPSQKLHVVGTGMFTDFVRFNGVTAPDFPVDIDSVDGGKALRSTRGTSIFRIDQSNDGPGYIGMQSDDDLSIQTNNTSRVYITSGGNVGIGTTSPSGKLEVISSTFDTAYLTRTIAGAASLVMRDSNDSGGVIQSIAGGGIRLLTRVTGTNSSSRIDVTSAGNVGIGTTAPTYKLEIRGAFGTSPGAYISGSTYGILGVNKEINNASAGVNYYNVGSQRWFTGVYENTDDFGFYSVGTGGFPMVIKYGTGNVGIGTTAPATKLDIAGAHVSSIGLLRLNSSAGNISAQTYYIDGAYKAAVYASTDNNFFLWGRDGDTVFSTTVSNTERMRITSAGALLVGTTSTTNTASGKIVNRTGGTSNPDLALNGGGWSIASIGGEPALYLSSNIAAATGIAGATQTAKGGIGFEYVNAAAPTDLVLGIFGSPTVASSVRIFNNTERVRITSGGNVGIGTTAPASTRFTNADNVIVDVKGKAINRGGVITLRTSDSSKEAFLANDAGLLQIGMYTNNDVAFYTNDAEAMRIKSGGNVGIGTTNPPTKLTVNGGTGGDTAKVLIQGNDAIIKLGDNGLGGPHGIQFDYETAKGDGMSMYYRTSPEHIVFENSTGTGGSGVMVIQRAGNVGIGTDSPDALLEISGNAGADPGPITNPTTFRITDAGTAATGAGDTTNPWGRIQFYSEDQSSGGPSVQAQIASIYGNVYSSSSHLAFYTQALPTTGIVERMRILDTGGVSVGTTAATGLFNVEGTSYFANDIYLRDGSVSSGDILVRIYDSSDDGVIDVYRNNSVVNRIHGNGVSYFNAGNVGIGTTNPGGKLQVELASSNSYDSATLTTPIAIVSNINSSNVNNQAAGLHLYTTGWSGSTTGVVSLNAIQIGGNASTADFAIQTRNAGVYAERFRLTAAGNVGIGTASPTSLLHLSSNSATHEANGVLSVSGGVNAVFNSTERFIFNIDSDNTQTDRTFDIAANRTGSSGGTLLFRVQENGNVGIGTTNPSAKLDVAGQIRQIVGGDYWYVSASATASLQTNEVTLSRSSSGYVSAFPYKKFTRFKASVAFKTLTSTHLGIVFAAQDSSPDDNNYAVIIRDVDTVRVQKRVSGTQTYPIAEISLSGVDVDDNNWHTISMAYDGAYISVDVDGTNYISQAWTDTTWTGAGHVGLHIYDGSVEFNQFVCTETTSKDVSSTMLVSGNVGIGTTSPAQKLDVNGASILARGAVSIDPDAVANSVIAGAISDTSWGVSSGIAGMASGAGDTWAIGHNSTNLYFGIGNGTAANSMSTYIEVTPSRDITFNGQVRITSGGNVGIGTTNPTVPLQIVKDNATISMTNTTAFAVDTGSRLLLGGKYSSATSNNTTPFAWIVGAKENATDGNQAGYLSITTVENGGGFAERMRVTSTGKVGIGYDSPYDLLHIHNSTSSGTPDAQMNFTTGVTGATDGNGLRVGWNGSVGNFYLFENADMRFATNDSERLRITSTGNVGIGTTAPSEKLTVNGNIDFPFSTSGSATFGIQESTTNPFATSAKDLIIRGANAFTGASPSQAQAGGDVYIKGGYAVANTGIGVYAGDVYIEGGEAYGGATSGAGKIYLKTAGQSRVIVDNAGNVGIGTTSPARILTVSAPSGDTILRTNAVTGSYAGLELTENNSTTSGQYWQINKVPTSHRLQFWNGSERLTILSNGNVGIGTTAPVARLHVTSSTNNVEVLRVDNTAGNSGSVQGITHLGLNFFGVGNNSGARITSYQEGASGYRGGMYFSTRGVNSDSAPSEAMRITPDQYVGIGPSGTTSANHRLLVDKGAMSYAIYTEGAIQINNAALGVNLTPSATAGRIDASNDIVAYSTSDNRLKENVTPIANALDKVKSLAGVEFDWKEETKDVHGYEGHDVGVIAQEVQAVLPEAVRTNDSGYLSVRYEKMIALLIEGMKEQQNQIDELKAKLDGLTK